MSRMRANGHSVSVRRVASAAGSHFFDRDAMRFFDSRVLGDAWAGWGCVAICHVGAVPGVRGARRGAALYGARL